MTRVEKGRAVRFLERLAEIVGNDSEAPDVVVALADETSIDDEGRVRVEAAGAEAILIVRGAEGDRETAIRGLLARFK